MILKPKIKNCHDFFVPNNDGLYRDIFVEQVSVTKDIQSSLKLTKNVEVAVRHGATTCIKSMGLKAGKHCENTPWQNEYVKNYRKN